MRLIVVGCEYTGKTTLLQGLMEWGLRRGIRYHLDDHFTIPDCQMLRTEEDRAVMIGLPEIIKERFQRFQVAYHVRLLNKFEHITLGGFHIEETVYGPRYYYPSIGRVAEDARAWEAGMPADTILTLLTARTETIEERMATAPREYPVVPKADIQTVLDEFQAQFGASWLKRKFRIDTSDLTPEGVLDAFMTASFPHLTERDMLIRSNDPPGLHGNAGVG